MQLVKRPVPVTAHQWTGDNLAELHAELAAPTRMGFDPTSGETWLELFAGKRGAQGWVPVPVGHWVFTDGSGDDFWPVEDGYVTANYTTPD